MRVIHALREFIALESAGGILLAIAAAAALTLANSPLAFLYDAFLDTPVEVRVGALQIAKPLLLWVNDGLMAIFFFLVGLEIKRELLQGELSTFSQAILPVVAAFGGELKIDPKAFIFIEAGFRIARFEGLAGEGVYTDSDGARTTEGGTLYYLGAGAYPQLIIANVIIPVEGNRPAVVNLSGWAIRGGVRFRF